jgi:tagatose 6-phosphate kinase
VNPPLDGQTSTKRRILVVALNPALDITHELPRVDWAGVNRPAAVRSQPGGKGVNVARTLHALGADVLVAGLAGGAIGAAVGRALAEAGVPAAVTAIAGETRRTFAVVDALRGQTALFNEPGPRVTPGEYASFLERYESELARSAAVVLTGSLPPGLAPDTYAGLTATATAAGVPAVLDADGKALLDGLAAHPAVVKPNLAELSAAVGRGLPDRGAAAMAETAAAAAELRDAGARAVVVSLGARGLLAVTAEGVWRAEPPGEVAGNPTGAGDAAVAGLTHRLVLGDSWVARLRHAVALGSAAAAAPVAGEFGRADYERALDQVSVTRLGTG